MQRTRFPDQWQVEPCQTWTLYELSCTLKYCQGMIGSNLKPHLSKRAGGLLLFLMLLLDICLRFTGLKFFFVFLFVFAAAIESLSLGKPAIQGSCVLIATEADNHNDHFLICCDAKSMENARTDPIVSYLPLSHPVRDVQWLGSEAVVTAGASGEIDVFAISQSTGEMQLAGKHSMPRVFFLFIFAVFPQQPSRMCTSTRCARLR